MALSAEIYGRFMPKSVADYDAEYEQGQASKQARELNALRLLSGQRQEREAVDASARDNALRGLVGGFGADENANALSLLRGGHLEAAQKYQKANADRQKELAEAKYKAAQADKERIAGSLSKLEAIGQLMGGVSDQATYDMARQQAAATFGPEFMAQVPPVYDPARIAQAQQQAMSVKERLEQEWKAKGYALDVRKQGEVERSNVTREAETGRHNRSTEGIGYGNLKVAQGNLGVSRERLNLDRAAPRGVLDPERGLLVDPRTGEARPITVGGQPVGAKANDKPTTEGERVAGGYLLRMQRADELVNQFEKEGRPSYAVEAAAKVGGATGRRMVTGEVSQKYRQAQEDWVRAKLRKESGAVIAADEMDREIETYFPQPGEGEGVAKQKAAARKTAEEAMTLSAGRATPKPAGAPAVGTVQGGYRFKGGNPADKANWEPVK
jgi:hypothetical protein